MGTKSGFSAFPCGPYFIWEFPSESEAIGFIRTDLKHVTQTLLKWQCSEAVFRSPDSDPIRLPLAVLSEMEDAVEEPSPLLWFANVGITPALLQIANDLMQNPRRAGVVRLSDELQVIMSDECSVLNPCHSMSEATQWVRSQFWHPDDLDQFRRLTREYGDRYFEFTWRSFDPDLGALDVTEGNWMSFTTGYELLIDDRGNAYQICNNKEFRFIAAPSTA